MRVNAEDRDGAPKQLPGHNKKEQVLEAGGGALLVARGAISDQEVEAIIQANLKFAFLTGLDFGHARPAVYCAEVVQEHGS